VSGIKLKKDSFIYKAFVLISSNLVLQLLALTYRILLGRMISADDLGTHTLVMQCYSVIMSFCVYGLCAATTNLSAQLKASNDTKQIPYLVKVSFCLFLILYLFLSIPIIVFQKNITYSALNNLHQSILPLLLCCIFFTGIENILKAVFVGMQTVKITSFSEIMELSIRIITVVALIISIENKKQLVPTLILLGMTFSEIFSVVFLIVTYCKKILNSLPSTLKISMNEKKQCRKTFLRIAFPSCAISLSTNLFSSFATLILPKRLIASGMTYHAAISALGTLTGKEATLFILPNIFIIPISTLLMTDIPTLFTLHKPKALYNKIQKCIQLTSFIVIPFAAIFIPLIPPLYTLLFHGTMTQAHIWMLTLQTVFSCYIVVLSNILNGYSLQKHVFYYTLADECLQLILIYFLSSLPTLQIKGYLLGTLCGSSLKIILVLLKTKKELPQLRIPPFSCFIAPLITGTIIGLYAQFISKILILQLHAPLLSIIITIGICTVFYFTIIYTIQIDFLKNIRNALQK